MNMGGFKFENNKIIIMQQPYFHSFTSMHILCVIAYWETPGPRGGEVEGFSDC
jgi:hypothetical protein